MLSENYFPGYSFVFWSPPPPPPPPSPPPHTHTPHTHTHTHTQIQALMQGHIDDLTESKVVVGDNLESALELGEKHEAFVTKCKEVGCGVRVRV